MRGRKPLATAVKLALGNPGKRPLNRREPKPVTAVPTCPAHLMPTAKTEWKRLARYLHDLGVISELDRAALAAYCQAYGRWVEAREEAEGDPSPSQDAGRLCPDLTLAGHLQQERRADAQVHVRAWAVAGPEEPCRDNQAHRT